MTVVAIRHSPLHNSHNCVILIHRRRMGVYMAAIHLAVSLRLSTCKGYDTSSFVGDKIHNYYTIRDYHSNSDKIQSQCTLLVQLLRIFQHQPLLSVKKRQDPILTSNVFMTMSSKNRSSFSVFSKAFSGASSDAIIQGSATTSMALRNCPASTQIRSSTCCLTGLMRALKIILSVVMEIDPRIPLESAVGTTVSIPRHL